MGECLITRRSGESYELPVLNPSYPQNVTVTQAATVTATFSVVISTPGKPAEYTYQWYLNGSPISGATSATYTHNAYRAAGDYTVYCNVSNKAGTVSSRNATFTVRSYLPIYTYSGSAQLIDDGNYNWRLKLLTSGNLTFTNLGNGAAGVQVFLVGGGGGGGDHTRCGGGGGGYTKTVHTTLVPGTGYNIIIGGGGGCNAGGGTTSTAWATANGGGTSPGSYYGGPGGSGGGGFAAVGGSDGNQGGNGEQSYYAGGSGQGSTTREFGEIYNTPYAGGGGGGRHSGEPSTAGGAGGGGNGGGNLLPTNGAANTGGGGGGAIYMDGNHTGASGGSGIVIIRNHR